MVRVATIGRRFLAALSGRAAHLSRKEPPYALVPLFFPALWIASLLFAGDTVAGGQQLYGVHWWDYSNPTVGSGPQGGWSVETVVTESDPWWRASWFVPLYQQVTTTHNAELITRIDYDWGENRGQTVPAPASSSATDWANRIVSEVVNPLGAYAHRWIIGNEPNITSEGTGWPSNQITSLPQDMRRSITRSAR